MKRYPILLAVSLFLLASTTGRAQTDTARISAKILSFADSFVKADYYKNWSAYADLVPLSVLKYYGGKEGYIEHVGKFRPRTTSDIEEESPELKVLQMATVNSEWQCVIRQSRYFHKEDKKYHFITYFIGQSIDDGDTWKFFDVSYTTVAKLNYQFPEIFGELAIHEPVILTPEQEAAQQAAQQTAAVSSTAKKGTPRKK
ncbi:MAG TPA: hypothetical protein VGM30_00510 [Puia sp.]|jgi:hypothetical protein